MNRREAVKTATLLVGGAVAATTGLLGCVKAEPLEKPGAEKIVLAEFALSAPDRALVTAVADTILPDTAASPGAKAADVGPFISLLLADVYDGAARTRALDGLAALRQRSPDFATMPQAARETLLRTIDAEATTAGPNHWFHLLHELSVKAYFSTEIGTTKALRYVREPGRFDGCVPMTKGQPAWA
jgi:hypothetical protein